MTESRAPLFCSTLNIATESQYAEEASEFRGRLNAALVRLERERLDLISVPFDRRHVDQSLVSRELLRIGFRAWTLARGGDRYDWIIYKTTEGE